MDLMQYIYPIRKWWWLLVISAVLAAASSYYMVSQQPPIYQATSTLLIGRAFEDPNPNSSELYLGQQLARTYADISRRQPVRQGTMAALGINSLPSYVARPVPNSQLLEISVVHTDPFLVQAVANELANQLILQSPTSQGPDSQERQDFVNSQLESLQVNIEETENEILEKQLELEEAFSARAIADLQSEINGLQSKLNTLQENYGRLLASTGSGATNTLSLIEPAGLPSRPVGPNWMQTVLTTVVVAVALATGTAYLLVYLDDTIKTTEDVSRISNLPSLPAIPLIKPKNGEFKIISLEKPLDPAVDAFRALRTVVQFKVKTKSNPVILVTSSLPEDGKSFVAANLAVVFAQGGSSVLLMDADLRRPSQHRLFGLSNGGGFSTFLQNYKPNITVKSLQEILEKSIETTDQENLWIMRAGGSNGFDLSMLDMSLIEEVLWLAKNRFEYIVIDSAPLLATADPLSISASVDGVILVASAGRTRRKQMKQMVNQLEMIEANVLGVTLNRVKENSSEYAYKYYGAYAKKTEDDETNNSLQESKGVIGSAVPEGTMLEQAGETPQA